MGGGDLILGCYGLGMLLTIVVIGLSVVERRRHDRR